MKKNIKKMLMVLGMPWMIFSCTESEDRVDVSGRLLHPEFWSETKNKSLVANDWLQSLGSLELVDLVAKAVKENLMLTQISYDLKIARQSVRVSGSDLWPTLDFSVSQGKTGTLESGGDTKSASIGLVATQEIDFWQKLSDAERESKMNFLAVKARYDQARLELVVDVASSWLEVIEAKKLLDLYEKRVRSTEQNMNIIETGYRRGLNEALDVYLVRNELSTEKSRVSAQKLILKERRRGLERFLGKYPSSKLTVNSDFPELKSEVSMGKPSDMLNRKPSIVARWNDLLARDAALAFAHKERFPQLSISASVEDRGKQISNLFTGAPTFWSLLGGMTAPIFNAGRLKANEEVARLELKKAEYTYLDEVYSSFQDVEQAAASEIGLKEQYMNFLEAEKNAITSAEMSFSRYQKGLENYTTVLEAQKRSYDAQRAVIETRKMRIDNRVRLHLALGGNFDLKKPNPKSNP